MTLHLTMRANVLAKLPGGFGTIDKLLEILAPQHTRNAPPSQVILFGKPTWQKIWMFAFWDAFYYVGLWLMLHWPPSLFTQDVLFLIPTPWIAPVWLSILVSLLTIAELLLANRQHA